ncbi:MAG: GNAT family N-acetyltransferase [Raoultibacter sp.]
MQLPGLITVQPDQTKRIEDMARMMGKNFMEELWTIEWLSSLDAIGASDERKQEIAQAIMKYDFIVGTPYESCYMLPDMAAGAGGYLASDLKGQQWEQLEEKASALMAENTLSSIEQEVLFAHAEKMHHISDFSWEVDAAAGNDFIHFTLLGVNPEHRGSGAFRKLITPFFDYADKRGINCYLECYSDKLESLYSHVGFKTLKVLSDSAFSITERCMLREPRA